MADDERILREVEFQVLDHHHLQFKLLQRNGNEAIEGVLRCYGNIVRGLRNGSIAKNSEDAKSQTADEGFRGLAHCLRWIREHCPQRIIVASPGNDALLAEALDLLRWGVNYDPLYNEHTAYSRKVSGSRFVEAHVSEAEKSITFLPNKSWNPRFYVSQVEAKKADDARQAAKYPDERLAELSNAWFQSVHPGQAGIRFDDTTIMSSGALEVVIEWLKSSCLPECSDDCQMGQFTVGSLRRVLASVHTASYLRVRLDDFSDNRPSAEQRFVTHVLSWPWHELIRWLVDLTAVDRSEISAILTMLTFDAEPERVTVAHKPFILGSDDRVFLSPRIFLTLPYSQMVVGAVNLTRGGKKAYDGISTRIEQAVVARIADGIRTGCLTKAGVVSGKTFQLRDEEITPDLVLLSSDATEVLVVDVKNATPPFGFGDIAEDLKEWSDKWQPQLSAYVHAFQNTPGVLSQHFSNCEIAVPRVFGIIVLRWPFPVPVAIPDTMGAIDWPTLHEHLNTAPNGRTISDLHDWIRNRPDCAVVESLQWKEKSIRVGEWTYRYSVLSPTVSMAEAQLAEL